MGNDLPYLYINRQQKKCVVNKFKVHNITSALFAIGTVGIKYIMFIFIVRFSRFLGYLSR